MNLIANRRIHREPWRPSDRGRMLAVAALAFAVVFALTMQAGGL